MRRITLILQFCFIEQIFSSCPWSYPHRNGESCCSLNNGEKQGIWGINNTGIYVRNGLQNSWQPIPGPTLEQITVGNMGVFGLSLSNTIYYRTGTYRNVSSAGFRWQELRVEEFTTLSFKSLSFSFHSISSGKNVVVGLYDFAQRTKLMKPGLLMSFTPVFKGDVMMWKAVSIPIGPFTAPKLFSSSFTDILENARTLNLRGISVSPVNDAMWGLRKDGTLFYKKTPFTSWIIITGKLREVKVGRFGVFGVTFNDEILYRKGTNQKPDGTEFSMVPSKFSLDNKMGWQTLSLKWKSISVGIDNVWAVNSEDKIFTMTNIRFTKTKLEFSWQQIDGEMRNIFTNGAQLRQKSGKIVKTELEWETDSSEKWSGGTFGFIAYDANKKIVHKRPPSYTKVGKKGGFEVDGNIEWIKFNTNTEDGFLGLITVKTDGVNQQFECLDCLSSSSTTELSRIYLDTDNTPDAAPGSAHCDTRCTFRIHRPLPVKCGRNVRNVVEATTQTGRQCQRWDTQKGRNLAKYPNADLTSNYCRDPTNAGFLWCYTTDPSSPREKCFCEGTSLDFILCDSNDTYQYATIEQVEANLDFVKQLIYDELFARDRVGTRATAIVGLSEPASISKRGFSGNPNIKRNDERWSGYENYVCAVALTTTTDCYTIGEIDVRSCPNSHPYSFLNGLSCCQSGIKCEEDEVFAQTSTCCHQNASIQCKHQLGCYNSRELQSVQCPVTHPFVYFGGRFCCANAHTSDKEPINIHSKTCRANAFTPCSHHSNCKNHQSVSADLSALQLQEHWVSLVSCGSRSVVAVGLKCEYEIKVGISRSQESSSGTSTEVRAMSALEVAMGVEVGGELWGGKVTGEIRQKFEHESTSGFTWSTTHSETFVNEHNSKFTMTVPEGEIITLCHLVADFGHLRIKTNFVKPVLGLDCSAAN